MRRIHIVIGVLVISFSAAPAICQTPVIPANYRQYDTNGDSLLNRSELVAFAKADDPKRTVAQAEDLADDILSYICTAVCTQITFDDFIIFLQDRNRRAALGERKLRNPFWRGFAISREVVDAVNPRAEKSKAAAVVSVKWNEEAASSSGKREETILGAFQAVSLNFGEANTQLGVSAGADFDIDGSKAKNETTVAFGVPITVLRIRGADDMLESVTFGVTPKRITDRAWKRQVNEVAVYGSFTSKAVAAGFVRPSPVRRDGLKLPPITWYWIPSAQLELGRVNDAGGNVKLIPFEGESYVRIVPRAKLTVFPNLLSESLRLDVDYLNRFDVGEDWNRPYFEGRMSYDLIYKGAAELTLIHRRGRKPPQFSKLNELLLGFGVKL